MEKEMENEVKHKSCTKASLANVKSILGLTMEKVTMAEANAAKIHISREEMLPKIETLQTELKVL